MADAYICDFVRTPIGRYAGALKDVRTDDLGAGRSRQRAQDHRCCQASAKSCAHAGIPQVKSSPRDVRVSARCCTDACLA